MFIRTNMMTAGIDGIIIAKPSFSERYFHFIFPFTIHGFVHPLQFLLVLSVARLEADFLQNTRTIYSTDLLPKESIWVLQPIDYPSSWYS